MNKIKIRENKIKNGDKVYLVAIYNLNFMKAFQ